MSIILEGGCRVSEMREAQPLVNGTLRIWNRIGRATGAQAISLRVMEFAPGRSPVMRNDDCDEILYVIDSSGTKIDLLLGAKTYDLTSDSGVYVRPGETFAIDNPGPGSIVIISSQCPDPETAPQFVDHSDNESVSTEVDPPPLVRLADRPAQPTADRWYRVLVDDEVGSTQVTQFVGSIPPGRAPNHFHNYEEVLFILRGEGRMWAGESNTPISTGSCIYLPRGQVHCVENSGPGELRLLGVFYPAGSPSVRYDVSEARP